MNIEWWSNQEFFHTLAQNPFSPKGDRYFVNHEKPFIRPLELELARKRVGQGKILEWLQLNAQNARGRKREKTEYRYFLNCTTMLI
jgi:hypothetical protein